MAVVEDIPGLHVTVSAKKEYVDPDEEQPEGTVTKYIEASSGEEFSICWDFKQNFKFKDNDIVSYIYLDGKVVDGLTVQSERLQGPSGYNFSLAGARAQKGGKWIERKYLFADLNVDEDNHGLHKQGLKESVGYLGEITIRFWRVRVLGASNSTDFDLKFDTMETVPEKALKGKAISHQATLGAAQTIPSLQALSTTWIDLQDKPFAVFNFRYRSHKALQTLGMVPRTPEPVPLEERPIDSLTPAEMRELLRRQKDQQVTANKVKKEAGVKRERANDDDSDAEGKRKRGRSATTGPIETIDLTDA